MQFAKHLQLSQRNAQPRQCCVPPCRVHCRVIPLCRVIWLVLWGVRKTDTGRLAPFRFYSSGDTALCGCGSKFQRAPCLRLLWRCFLTATGQQTRRNSQSTCNCRNATRNLVNALSPLSPLFRVIWLVQGSCRMTDSGRLAPFRFYSFRGHSTLWVRLKIPKGAALRPLWSCCLMATGRHRQCKPQSTCDFRNRNTQSRKCGVPVCRPCFVIQPHWVRRIHGAPRLRCETPLALNDVRPNGQATIVFATWNKTVPCTPNQGCQKIAGGQRSATAGTGPQNALDSNPYG